MRWLWALAGAVLAVLGRAEVVHRRSSTRRLGSYRGPVRNEVVVVLGCANRGERANVVNRYRMRAGLRSRDAALAPSTLVLSGAAVAGHVSEAALMLAHARRLGHEGPVVLEETSRTTWENVQQVLPLLEATDRIVFASNSLHAEKARAHLWQTRPDLAEHLVRADEHRFGELVWLKPLAAVIGLRNLRKLPRARPAHRGEGTSAVARPHG